MKKIILLFVLALLPVFGFGQSPIVKWHGTIVDWTPTTKPTFYPGGTASATSSQVSADNISGVNINFVHNPYNGFVGSGWPTSTSPDLSKYFLLKVKAKAGYKIDATKLVINCKGTNKRMVVKYSKNADFSNETTTTPITNLNFNNNNQELTILLSGVNTSILPEQTLYIRIYGYESTGSGSWELKDSPGNAYSDGPAIYGTVSVATPQVLTATADSADILKNSFSDINVLANDTTPNGTTISTVTVSSQQQSANGAAVVNADKTIRFTPSPNYVGNTSFQYTVTNSAGSSASATVTVNVTAPVLEPLVRWSNTDRTATSPSNNAIGGTMTPNGGIVIDNIANNNTSQWFQTGGWPVSSSAPSFGALDESKYVEYSITAKPGTRIDLDQFKFQYAAQGSPQSFQVWYSQDDFATHHVLQKDSLVSTTWRPFAKKMTKAEPLFPGKTMKVRIYAYKTNNNFNVKRVKDTGLPNDFSETAMITGIVSGISNTPIAIDDNISMLENAENYEMKILNNDYYHNATAGITITQNPTHGTLSVSGQTVLYTPTEGYNGDDSFKYKITDVNGVSNEGVVAIKVNLPSNSALVYWNNNNFSPTIVNNNVISANLTINGGVSLSSSNNNNTSNWFETGSWPSANSIDTSKYIEFSINAKPGTKINLESIKFNYQFTGTATYQVRYSRDNFATNTVLQVATANPNTQWNLFEKSLISVDPLLASDTHPFKIRVYVYNTNNVFRIRRLKTGVTPDDFSETPTISGTLAMQGTLITTWKGVTLGWTNGIPSLTKDAIIDNDYNIIADEVLSVKNLTINAGKKVTVLEKGTLQVQNNVTVLTGANIPQAEIIVENNGSFVQKNDNATYTGLPASFTVKRYTQLVRRYDFTYWSSPVREQDWTLNNLSPYTLSDKYYSYNPASGWVIHYGGNIGMATGRGYIVRAPQTFEINNQAIDYNTKFTGIPNNGIKTFTMGAVGSYNLIGNPYPSALDADEFIRANQNSITGALYFWTHNTAVQNYAYSPADYATYTLLGGAGTQSAYVGGVKPDGKIASGQGFFVQRNAVAGAQNVATLTFNNSMRPTGNNNQFFKPAPTEVDATIYKHRFWLNVSNANNDYSEMLLGYMTGATDGLDNGYDGETFGGNVIALYSKLDATNLVVQAKALPFDENDVIPVGYTTTVGGQFTINLNQFDGTFENQNIFLEDKLTNTITNLKETDYVFTTAAGTFDARFEVKFVNATLGVDTPTVDANSMVIFRNGSQIDIKSKDHTIEQVTVYDLLGKVIFDKNKIKAASFSTAQLNAGNQVVIVKVITDTKAEVVKKVIMN